LSTATGLSAIGPDAAQLRRGYSQERGNFMLPYPCLQTRIGFERAQMRNIHRAAKLEHQIGKQGRICSDNALLADAIALTEP
jgi:hypothetical protein